MNIHYSATTVPSFEATISEATKESVEIKPRNNNEVHNFIFSQSPLQSAAPPFLLISHFCLSNKVQRKRYQTLHTQKLGLYHQKIQTRPSSKVPKMHTRKQKSECIECRFINEEMEGISRETRVVTQEF